MTETRVSVTVHGTVQGVGFRPFVHGLATTRGLSGWVQNVPRGVRLELQGDGTLVDDALAALRRDLPAAARIVELDVARVTPVRELGFRILPSVAGHRAHPSIPPDLAMCDDCRREVDGDGRRASYPFTSCARCGPRLTITTEAPYDRAHTTMAPFAMCDDCQSEYDDIADRRHHAQPIACPACGPTLEFEGARGRAALAGTVEALRAGLVVALKGIGGYQLLVDATNDVAVATLRARKHRPERPFAVLFSSVAVARQYAEVSDAEAHLLGSPTAPIVLCRRRREALDGACGACAPWLGAMLPASPLHHLVVRGVGRPLVCTSGNRAHEPICTDDDEARVRLSDLADAFATHDRAVARPVDDSIVRVRQGVVEVQRRARGFAPAPLRVEDGPTVLALGAHQKGTVALGIGREIVVSPHLGDLGTARGAALLERTARELLRSYGARLDAVACDLHPDYASTHLAERFAQELGAPLVRVQHHHAHARACLAEHGHDGDALALVWDGTGLGADGTAWGGEALRCVRGGYLRVGHLRAFPLPGGDGAAREPRRSALGLVSDADGCDVAALFEPHERDVLTQMIRRGVGSPMTTSVGRLFDAVAALAGVRARCSFDAQAAIELEALATGHADVEGYPMPLSDGVLDPRPLARGVCEDRAAGVPRAIIAARFHVALADAAVALALAAATHTVALSGGCFQNAWLSTLVQQRLEARGFRVLLPALYPANDGGLSLGQVVAARAAAQRREHVPRAAG